MGTRKSQHCQLTLLAMVLLVLYINASTGEGATICPKGCTCEEVAKATCSGIDIIPNFANKSLIKSLSISNHNITRLNKGDFTNFTHLTMFDLTRGILHEVAAGTFDDVRESVVKINLKSNLIADLDSDVFANLKFINEIDLDSNHLAILKANSFTNLSKLVTLTVRSNHLESVDKDAFNGLSELQNLNLYNNRLTEIPFESINGLKTLVQLNLSFNKIKSIPEETITFIPTLEDIYLDSNPIQRIKMFPNISSSLKRVDIQFTDINLATKLTWKYLANIDILNLAGTKFHAFTAGTFEGLTKVKKVFIRDMPLLMSVGPDAFNGLQSATTIDLADCNRLHAIDETAFMSTNVSAFFLQDSAITYIPEHLLKWSKMKTLMISGNPINCDCKIKWMLNASTFGNNSDIKSSFDGLRCDSPTALNGSNVTSLLPTNVTCHSSSHDHASRFITGIVVVIICFITFVILALITKYRNRIMISCRRYYQYRRYQNDLVFTVEHDTSITELDDTDGAEGRPLKDMRLETVPLEM